MRKFLGLLTVIVLATGAGAMIGYGSSRWEPNSYRSSATIMVESDGENTYGFAVVDSLIKSDKIQSMAYVNSSLDAVRDGFEDQNEFAKIGRASLSSNAKTGPDEKVLIVDVSYDSKEPKRSQAALDSYCSALKNYIRDQGPGTESRLERLISVAIEDIQPKIIELENRYREFRRDAPLAWDKEGNAINPHRERQVFLVARRSELHELLRAKQITLNQIETLAKRAKDPVIALEVIRQLLDTDIEIESMQTKRTVPDSKLEILDIKIDRELIPLMIQRNKFAQELGENHPSVKTLDKQLETMKAELEKLVEQNADRIKKVNEKIEEDERDPKAVAAEAVAAIIYANQAEVKLLETQLADVDKRVAAEKESSDKLAQYELENRGLLRELDRNKQLLEQLETQLSQVTLNSSNKPTKVVLLTKPSPGNLSQGNGQRLATIGALIGFVGSLVLSLLYAVTTIGSPGARLNA